MIKNLILLLSVIVTTMSGQTSVTPIKVEYNEYRIYMPSIVNLDLGTLLVNNEMAYYKSTLGTKQRSNAAVAEDAILINEEQEVLSEYVINKKNNLLTEFLTEKRYLKKNYAVAEPIPAMTWILSKETKSFKNYICKKASTTFRGRVYNAWYTDKIPVSVGPWKFSGLPGLIMAIEDSKGIYKWDVRSITYPFKGEILSAPAELISNKKFKKLTLREYDDLRIAAMKLKVATVKARNPNRISGKVGLMLSTEQDKEPYYPWRPQTEF